METANKISVNQLAEAISAQIRPEVPVEYAMWGIKKIAAWLDCSESKIRILVSQGDFPASYRIKGGYRRWRAKEIIQWAEQFRCREVSI